MIAQDEHRAALIAAIEGEYAAFKAKDYTRWAEHWMQGPAACHWNWTPQEGMSLSKGWDQISVLFRHFFATFPEPEPPLAQRDWREFHITADMAFVTFDQRVPFVGRPSEDPGLKNEMRVMVRDHGRWRHLCVISLQPQIERARCPVLQVDASGRVLRQNDLAVERLAQPGGLILRAGRLRAQARAADRALQASIAWAAGAPAGPAKSLALERPGVTGGAMPILSAGGAAEPAILCWVQPVNGEILVTLDDKAAVDQRLASAAVIFGLSPSQQRLVALLAEGSDLAAAADTMAVSVNTLRTQLRRIFDKTNVHNQAALLRLMLSIAPPLQ